MGLSPASSHGGGVSHSTVGTTAAGASFDNPGTAAKWYYKKVTLASNALLTCLLVQVKGDNTNGVALTGGVWSDSAGSIGTVIAMANQSTRNPDTGSKLMGMIINSTVRQIALPIGKWLTAADYWLGVWLGSTASASLVIAYNAGTGTDQTATAGSPNFFADAPAGAGATVNDFSIAADLLS